VTTVGTLKISLDRQLCFAHTLAVIVALWDRKLCTSNFL